MKQLEFNLTLEAQAEEVHETPLTYQEVEDRSNFELLQMLGFQGFRIGKDENIRETIKRLTESSTRLGELAQILDEIAQRYSATRMKLRSKLHSSEEVFNHYRFQLAEEKQEHFFIVLLDNKHGYLSEHLVSKGTLNKSLVHPREVFSYAIKEHAAALICVHNHPSGDPIASQQDTHVTRRLTEVGKLVGIPVLDHIIIGNHQYFSYADQGLM